MNHPTHEEWMSYLYDELSASACANLTAHLRACPDCKAKVDEWQAARKNLDAWQLPAKPPRRRLVPPVIKWAAAAAILLSVGFGAGWLALATTGVQKVRAAIEPEIRQQLRQEFAQLLHEELGKAESATLAASDKQTRELLADYATLAEIKRADDSHAIYGAFDKLEAQRVADYLSLKKDLDTVAVLTDAGLRHTEQQIVQLADYTQPASFSNSPQK